jgi:pimeloyl-ACP methyl ester carboxylesterase
MSALSAELYAEDGTVFRDGFDLHYRLENSGKPIIFLAGGPGFDVDYLEDAARLFPDGYQRILLEQRGTGRSRPARLVSSNISLALEVEDFGGTSQESGPRAVDAGGALLGWNAGHGLRCLLSEQGGSHDPD